jgi:hypothetical protein
LVRPVEGKQQASVPVQAGEQPSDWACAAVGAAIVFTRAAEEAAAAAASAVRRRS